MEYEVFWKEICAQRNKDQEYWRDFKRKTTNIQFSTMQRMSICAQ